MNAGILLFRKSTIIFRSALAFCPWSDRRGGIDYHHGKTLPTNAYLPLGKNLDLCNVQPCPKDDRVSSWKVTATSFPQQGCQR